MLQRSIDNQASLRPLAEQSSRLPGSVPDNDHEQEAALENMIARAAARCTSWDFSKIPLYQPDRGNQPQMRSWFGAPTLPGVLQPKLLVGPVHDPLEYEADRIADHVMGMSDSDLSVTATPPQISRKCTNCEEEQKRLRMKPTSADGALAFAEEAPAIVHEVLRTPGNQLDAPTRAYFEPRFRRDFADVRIHNDARAASSARQVGALAYTVGQHVVVDPARYRPGTVEGRRLLAHELAHTVQQSVPSSGTPRRLARTARSLTESLDPALLSDDELTTEIHEIRSLLDEQSETSEQGDMLAHAVALLGAELVKRHPPTPAPTGAPRAPVGVRVGDVLRASSAASGMLGMGRLSLQRVPVPAPPPVVMPPPTVVPPTVVPPTTAAGVGAGAVAAGIFVFIVVMLWPRSSIMSGREEQRLLDEARRSQVAGKSPQQGPGPAPGPRRHPNQTCDNETLNALQAEMHRVCDSIPGESCSPSKVSQKRLDRRPCSEIRLRIQALRECLAKRQRVQDLCFGGQPDQTHLDQMAQLTNGLNACLALEAVNCAPGHPMAGM
jgi:hypothetical protein